MTADHQETRPRGRPPVGPDVNYRLTAELRQALAAAKQPGESEAAAVRRLLTVALHPLTAPALRMAAATADTAEVRTALTGLADAADPDGARPGTLLVTLPADPPVDPVLLAGAEALARIARRARASRTQPEGGTT